MNLSALSITELAELIRAASLELASRMSEPEIQRIQADRPVIALREPPEDDKDYVLMVKAALERGSYITAAERQRVATIAAQYPDWVRRQGLPTEKGTWAWRDAAHRLSAPRARER